MTEILVFVPGLLGSELYDGDEKIWPGSGWNALKGRLSDDHFSRLLKEDLQPRDILRTAVGGLVDIYGGWISFFEGLRSHDLNTPLFLESQKTLVVVPYDWRKSCRDAAERLAKKLDDCYNDSGEKPEFHLIAHSLGGLVCRYLLQCMDPPKNGTIKTFITLGTPHNGAPIALAGALGIHKTDFLGRHQSKQLAEDPRYPSLYETFPTPESPLIWERKTGGRLLPRSLKDKTLALAELKLSEVNYQAYIKFRSELESRSYPDKLRRFTLVGTRYPTVTHFYWTGGQLQGVEGEDSGDGTVSIAGAYIPDVQSQFIGEAHTSLIRSPDARRVLQEIFGATGFLDGMPQIGVSVRDSVIEQGAPIYVSIITDGTLRDVSGEIVIEGVTAISDSRANFPSETDFGPLDGRAPQRFSYLGPDITSAVMKLPSIQNAGIYRVVMRKDAHSLPIATSRNFAVERKA